MGVNFLLIQRLPSERRTYALQHREHRVEIKHHSRVVTKFRNNRTPGTAFGPGLRYLLGFAQAQAACDLLH